MLLQGNKSCWSLCKEQGTAPSSVQGFGVSGRAAPKGEPWLCPARTQHMQTKLSSDSGTARVTKVTPWLWDRAQPGTDTPVQGTQELQP